MINKDRIVPVTATDLLTLYGVMFAIADTSIEAIESSNPLGDFEIASGSGNVLASEPVRSCKIGSDVSAIVVYFIPTYDYVGFTINGEAATVSGDEVVRDGKTLYSATLSSGAITIAKVGF